MLLFKFFAEKINAVFASVVASNFTYSRQDRKHDDIF